MDGDSAGGRGVGVGGRGQALAAMLAARRPEGPDDSTASSSTVSSKGRGQLLRDMARLGDSSASYTSSELPAVGGGR